MNSEPNPDKIYKIFILDWDFSEIETRLDDYENNPE
jgi:hypothetical protein